MFSKRTDYQSTANEITYATENILYALKNEYIVNSIGGLQCKYNNRKRSFAFFFDRYRKVKKIR